MNDMFVDTHKAVVESKKVYENISKNPLSFLDELPKLSSQLLPRSIVTEIAEVLGESWDSLEVFSDYFFKMYSNINTGDIFISIMDKETGAEVCILNMTQKQVEYVTLSTKAAPVKTLSETDAARVKEINDELKKLKPSKLQKIFEIFLPWESYRDTMEDALKSELAALNAKEKQNAENWSKWAEVSTYVKTLNENTVKVLLPIFSEHGFSVQKAR